MAHLVNEVKKKDWKLSNLYFSGVASMVVLFTVIIDLVSVFGLLWLKKLIIIIALILIAVFMILSYKYKEMLKRFSNKELLSEIFNAWSTFGIIIFVFEKFLLELIDLSVDKSATYIAVGLFAIFALGGILSTVVIVKKPEWKYIVDP